MGCIGSKESPSQDDTPPAAPIHMSQLDDNAMAAQLFSTRRNPNRRRAPSPGRNTSTSTSATRGQPYNHQPVRPGALYYSTGGIAAAPLAAAARTRYRAPTTPRRSTGNQTVIYPAGAGALPHTTAATTVMTRQTRARLTEYSRHQIDPGPYLSGHPILSSTDTLPRYELGAGGRPGTSASASASRSRVSEVSSGAGVGVGVGGTAGLVRRVGTGWSVATSHSGPPPSYHSVERPGRG